MTPSREHAPWTNVPARRTSARWCGDAAELLRWEKASATWKTAHPVRIDRDPQGLPEYDLEGLRLTVLGSARGAGVAVAESHLFAVRERIEPEELADQGWVVGPSSGDAPEFGAWPGIAEPRITFTARDWPTRLGLVAAGLGIALVPGIAAQAVPRGVRWIPVHDDTGGLRRAVWAATNDNPSAAAYPLPTQLRYRS